MKGSSGDYKNDLYLDSTHNYNVYVYGYTVGESYSTTVTASGSTVSTIYDGDDSDLTTNDVIYPEYSGYQTAYGHTDSIGDMDYGTLTLASSGYYDLSSTGNTKAAIWDATSNVWLYGNDYQSKLYVDATHANYLFVNGQNVGESYSATAKPYQRHFNITVDYRYDTQGFYTDYCKSVIEEVVSEWEEHIISDFATMPAGTTFYMNELLDIAVFFTDKSLQGPLPQVGEDCRGVFWLQGYLAG